jgi:methionyl-tRNA synthetase
MTRAFYVTTPIYYVNAEPHIGHTYTTVLADTLARYHRACGEKTFFLTGCDEHGEKVLEVARARGVSPREIADHYSARFRSTWDELDLRYDRFLRTTDPDHVRVVQQILARIHRDGHVYFQEYEGDYCIGCERFLTERDLVAGRCRDHDRVPERRREANYFFRMSAHFAWLERFVREHPDFIHPESYRGEVLGMLRDESGLGDLCISRPRSRLEWGIELPFDRDYVCYVWFDALINYLTGIGYPDAPDFADYWGACEHLVAKDILKPHAVFWPILLRAIGLEPMRRLAVHGYWNVDDRKVSKSLGNMVSPLAMRDRYGFEPFRYYLLREMSFGHDASFSEEGMVARVNADLANDLGNLVSRTLQMTGRFAGGRVPEPGPAGGPEGELRATAEAVPAEVDANLRRSDTRKALEALFRIVDAANGYLEKREPWRAAREAGRAEELRTTLATACEALRLVAVLLAPFLPRASGEILARLGVAEREGGWLPEAARWGAVGLAGRPAAPGPALFPRAEAPQGRDAEPGRDAEAGGSTPGGG